MKAQTKRGILEIAVLAAISREPSYGYKILQDISEFVTVTETALYPILRRLEKSGACSTYTSEYNGRLRKYYTVTTEGRAVIKEFT